MVILLWLKKKRRERIKIWTAVDRNRNKVVTFKISKDSNGNDKQVCRLLLEEVKNNIKINIIATDGNYSYNKVINKGYNIDCNKHIIDKRETSLVESYNGSLRGTSSMFIRRTKCYAKCLKSVYLGVKMWIYKKYIKDNLEKIVRCYYV